MRIVVTGAEDQTDNPPQPVLEGVWCLRDTVAQASFVVTHLLDLVVRYNNLTLSNLTQNISHAYGQIERVGHIFSRSEQVVKVRTFNIALSIGVILRTTKYPLCEPVLCGVFKYIHLPDDGYPNSTMLGVFSFCCQST
jgi:hypothetical protein